MTPTTALLAATALHAGFQVVVTVLVYPVLASTPTSDFAAAHDRHSRRIVPVVAVVYAVVAAACVWVLIVGPRTPATFIACAGSAVAAGATASLAAPAHGRLGRSGPTPELVHRLLVSDRLRCAGAVIALAGALLAAT